jgi:triphosphoribosyl-dephospho-CoA synthase
MQAAAERDMVARQYVNGFQTVLGEVAPRLRENVSKGRSIEYAIIETQLQLLRRYPDSLISRKCGKPVAEQASALADQVLSAGEPGSQPFEDALADMDFWMRADHHRRNPGTTADLIAAGLFAALREGQLAMPLAQRNAR